MGVSRPYTTFLLGNRAVPHLQDIHKQSRMQPERKPAWSEIESVSKWVSESLGFNVVLQQFFSHMTTKDGFYRTFIWRWVNETTFRKQVMRPTRSIILLRASRLWHFLPMLNAKRGGYNSHFYSLRCDPGLILGLPVWNWTVSDSTDEKLPCPWCAPP